MNRADGYWASGKPPAKLEGLRQSGSTSLDPFACPILLVLGQDGLATKLHAIGFDVGASLRRALHDAAAPSMTSTSSAKSE